MEFIGSLTSADLALSAGQSNMAGRGSAEDAVNCRPNAGFEYKSVSSPAGAAIAQFYAAQSAALRC